MQACVCASAGESEKNDRDRQSGDPGRTNLAEERQDGLRRLVGDGERLDTQLLLDLQRLESCAFLGQVGIDQIANSLLQRITQAGHETLVYLKGFRGRTKLRKRGVQIVERGLDRGDEC